MTFGELVDLTMRTLACEPGNAVSIATEMWQGERDYTTREIAYAADKLGIGQPEQLPENAYLRCTQCGWMMPVQNTADDERCPECEGELRVAVDAPTPEPEMTMDPGEVLAELYRVCPRVLTHKVPRIGRAPKESPFFRQEDIDDLLDGLPDETKLLIGAVDLMGGKLTITLYDEANDLDRDVGPLDLTRYRSSEELDRAIRVLISRLQSRVLMADLN